MKNFHRREFLKLAGAATAALAVDQVTGNKFLPGLNPVPKKNDAGFGIQLWSVRDAMEKDARGTLSELAKYGYGFVESYESPRGMFWGMKPVEFKNYLDSLGMAIYSSHCDSETGFEKKVTEAASIGMKHLFHAWEGPGKNLDDYKKMAQDFNRRGTICRQNGMRFGFHNHYFSFMPVQPWWIFNWMFIGP
jgi:sugar phosphate isomerase/epimerase